MALTTDPKDPELQRGPDQPGQKGMSKKYLVLPDEELKKGFVRPVRNRYTHEKCGTVTKMGTKLSETYARDPKFYGYTYCVGCQQHFPVKEFFWTVDNQPVGS